MTTTKVHVWWSAGGGTGKTSLAIIQAAALASKQSGKVALLDFKEVTPHIHFYLDLVDGEPTAIYDAIEMNNWSEGIKKYMQYKHGFYILPGIKLKDFHGFTEKHFLAILQAAKKEFEQIVVDTNDGIYFAATAAAIKMADHINVLMRPELATLSDTKEMVSFFVNNWKATGKLHYYLNFVHQGELSPGTVYEVLQVRCSEIPYSKEIAEIKTGNSPNIQVPINGIIETSKQKRWDNWLK